MALDSHQTFDLETRAHLRRVALREYYQLGQTDFNGCVERAVKGFFGSELCEDKLREFVAGTKAFIAQYRRTRALAPQERTGFNDKIEALAVRVEDLIAAWRDQYGVARSTEERDQRFWRAFEQVLQTSNVGAPRPLVRQALIETIERRARERRSREHRERDQAPPPPF